MNRIILADNQAIFRAGAARVIAVEDDMRIVAQCDDLARLSSAIDTWRGAILPSPPACNWTRNAVIAHARAAGIRTIYIAENNSEVPEGLARALDGVLFRSVAGPGLLECIRRVAAGQHSFQRSNVTSILAQDAVGARVPRPPHPQGDPDRRAHRPGLQEQAHRQQVNTKEQVIKNYLRSIYDKTGVSDRLEVALFTIHHRVLAEAAANASEQLQQAKSA